MTVVWLFVALAPSILDRQKGLNQFFKNAEASVVGILHEYFQLLLGIAATGRQYLGDATPLEWTIAHIHQRSCFVYVK